MTICRDDNDHQIILRYSITGWSSYEKPLNQSSMHRQGPAQPDSKYFVYTGNTSYGIQNLEYDEPTGCLFAAVYKGTKNSFPNYPMYVIDLKPKAEIAPLRGLYKNAETLSLSGFGLKDDSTGICGIDFPFGATGMISLGDGYFYFSRESYNGDSWGTDIGLYEFDGKYEFVEKV